MSTHIEIARPAYQPVQTVNPNDLSSGSFGVTLSIPFQSVVSEPYLYIEFPTFDCRLGAAIGEIGLKSDLVSVQLTLDECVALKLVLSGKLIDDGTEFSVEGAALQAALIEERPRADFVAATLSALLGLSEKVRLHIPEIGLDVERRFELSLLEVSQQLQARQIDYRLMVIEGATGLQFAMPPSGFSGEEIGDISFVYYAITQRSFVHVLNHVQLLTRANQESFDFVLHINTSGVVPPLDPKIVTRMILGHSVALGPQTYTINDAYVENLDSVLKELAENDGHEVVVTVRSCGNAAIYHLPEAPRLPPTPWAPEIQALVDLESRLDAEVFDRYNGLAAASLANLTDEQIAALTERPELDESAFLINESDSESDPDEGETELNAY